MPALTAAEATAIWSQGRRASSSRVMRFINLLQPLFNHVGINLRRRNVRVTQHQLHRPQIRPALQQMRGKAMSQHVWRQRHAQTRAPSVRRQNLPHTDPAERHATSIHKQRRARSTLLQQLWPSIAKVLLHRSQRFLSRRNNAFLIPLADAANAADLRVEIGDSKPVNSETRKPLEYNTSSIARSRKPSAVFVSGWASKRSTSSSFR